MGSVSALQEKVPLLKVGNNQKGKSTALYKNTRKKKEIKREKWLADKE